MANAIKLTRESRMFNHYNRYMATASVFLKAFLITRTGKTTDRTRRNLPFVKLAHFYSFPILESNKCSSVLDSAKAMPRNKSFFALIRNIKVYLMCSLVTD